MGVDKHCIGPVGRVGPHDIDPIGHQAGVLTLTDPRTGGLEVWLSSNALASINVVALRQTRLVGLPGWVTVCRRVNHLCM